jgi:hypothetical protein
MSSPSLVTKNQAVEQRFTKIKAFSLQNFKAVTDLVAELDGKSCIFYSKQNGGKTTASEHAIQTVVGNFKGSKLKAGENEGHLLYDLQHPLHGELQVLIELKKKGEKITINYPDGKSVTGKDATSFLKSLQSSAHRNDVTDLLSKSGQELVKELVKQLGIDYTNEEHEYKEAFDHRQNIKRDLDSQEHRIDPVTSHIREIAAKEEVSTSELAEKIRKATEHNNSIDNAKADLERYENTLTDLHNEREALILKLQEIDARIDKGNAMKEEKRAFLQANHKVKLDSLKEKLENADAENKEIREAKMKVDAYEKENEAYELIKVDWEEADEQVKAKRQAMYDKINGHQHGIEGLKINASVKTNSKGEETNRTEVTLKYNSLDFSTTEIAEGEMIAIALKIKAQQLKPGELGFFKLQANLLDNDTIIQLAEFAEKHGIQIGYELNTQANEAVQVTTDISDLISKRL